MFFSINVSAQENMILKTVYDSLMETDRLQSYQWYNGTKENPVITSDGYSVWEINPFVVSDNETQFDKKVDFGKALAWYLPEKIFSSEKSVFITRLTITAIEFYNVWTNDELIRNVNLSRKIVLSTGFDF